MWPCSRLVTAERDGYFAIGPSLRPNLGENEFYQLARNRRWGGRDKNIGDRKMNRRMKIFFAPFFCHQFFCLLCS